MRIDASIPGFLVVIVLVSSSAVLLAWALTSLLRRQSASLRHFLWLMAINAPVLALLLNALPIRIELPVVSAPAPVSRHEGTVGFSDEGPPMLPSVSKKDSRIEAVISRRYERIPRSFNVWVTLWMIGVAAYLTQLVWSHLRIARLLRDSNLAPSALLDRLKAAKKTFPPVRHVDLRIADWTTIPFCYGVTRPRIVFPANWSQWPDERIAICLGHELAHVSRGDLLALSAARFACLLCWFNPLIWLAAGRLRAEAERAADDFVLSLAVRPSVYASHLVAVAKNCQFTASSSVLSMARPNRLMARIEAILDARLRRKPPGFLRMAIISLAAVILVCAAVTVRLTASPAEVVRDLTTIRPQDRDLIRSVATDAIKAGDVKALSQLLQRGLNPNEALDSRCPLLFLAVDANQDDVVKLLLANGADVNRKTSWGDLSFRRACWRGNKAIADLLIAAGAPVEELLYGAGTGEVTMLEARDRRQPITAKEARSAIHFAVSAGQPTTFNWLWAKIQPLDDGEQAKLLGEYYEEAAAWGQAGMLQYLETKGADAKAHGAMALARAVSRNFPSVVKNLLEAGISPNERPPRWSPVLLDAASQGSFEIVKLLLDHGADANIRDGQGDTPLNRAAIAGKSDVCLLLMARGADPNLADDGGQNAAWHAAGGVYAPDALEAMIARGVDVRGVDKNGRQILNAIMFYSAPKPGKIAYPGKIYSDAEIKAHEASERRTIELLIAAGADFNGRPGTKTPLMSALEVGHHAAARALLAHNVDVSVKDDRGETALITFFNYPGEAPLALDILEILLQRLGETNPQIRVYNDDKKHPLMTEALSYAAWRHFDLASFREAIALLIDRGATFPQVVDAGGQRLLQSAVRGDLPAIQTLIRGGTSINTADADGWTALAITIALGYDDCVDWLMEGGAKVNQPARYSLADLAVRRGNNQLVARLLAKGQKFDRYALMVAVQQNNDQMFDSLIESGADATIASQGRISYDKGKTWYISPSSFPIYSCIENGNARIARVLLEKGAHPDPQNLTFGRSLLYCAVDQDQAEIARALIEYGADPYTKDSEGVSPLDLAKKSHKQLIPSMEEAIQRRQAGVKK